MKARTALLACVACLLAGAADSVADDSVDVTYAGGLLTVRCADVELADVLEQVGSAIDAELMLDDAIKSMLLTADVEAQPVQLALERLLEGRGVSYAMSLSPDGQRVLRMYVGSEAGLKSSTTTISSRARPPAPGPAANRNPGPVRPAPAPIAVPPSDDDEDFDAEMEDDAAPFAPLAPEGIPGIGSSSMFPSGGGASPIPQVSPAPPAQQKPAPPVNQ
jgi:hypothetical protein